MRRPGAKPPNSPGCASYGSPKQAAGRTAPCGNPLLRFSPRALAPDQDQQPARAHHARDPQQHPDGAFPDGNSALNFDPTRLEQDAGTRWRTKRYLNMDLLRHHTATAMTAWNHPLNRNPEIGHYPPNEFWATPCPDCPSACLSTGIDPRTKPNALGEVGGADRSHRQPVRERRGAASLAPLASISGIVHSYSWLRTSTKIQVPPSRLLGSAFLFSAFPRFEVESRPAHFHNRALAPVSRALQEEALMTDTKCGRKICPGAQPDPEADRWFSVRFPNWADKRPPKAGGRVRPALSGSLCASYTRAASNPG